MRQKEGEPPLIAGRQWVFMQFYEGIEGPMEEPIYECIRVTKEMGLRLRQARENKGLTQKQLADLVNASQSQIDAYEHGGLNIAVDRLFELSRILDVPMTDFFD